MSMGKEWTKAWGNSFFELCCYVMSLDDAALQSKGMLLS